MTILIWENLQLKIQYWSKTCQMKLKQFISGIFFIFSRIFSIISEWKNLILINNVKRIRIDLLYFRIFFGLEFLFIENHDTDLFYEPRIQNDLNQLCYILDDCLPTFSRHLQSLEFWLICRNQARVNCRCKYFC